MTDPCKSIDNLSRILELQKGIICIPDWMLWLGLFLFLFLSILIFWFGYCSRSFSLKNRWFCIYTDVILNPMALLRQKYPKIFPLLTYSILYLSLSFFFAFIYHLSYQYNPRTFSFKTGTSLYEQFLRAECSRRLIWNVNQANQIAAYTAWLVNEHGGSQEIVTFLENLPNKSRGIYLRSLSAISAFSYEDQEWSSEKSEIILRMTGESLQERKKILETIKKLSKSDPSFFRISRMKLSAFSFLESELENDFGTLKMLIKNYFGSFKKEDLSHLKDKTNFDINTARIGIENILKKGKMVDKVLPLEDSLIDPWETVIAVDIELIKHNAIYFFETHDLDLYFNFWIISLYGFIDKLPFLEIDPTPQSKMMIFVTLLNWILNGVIILAIINLLKGKSKN